ncbi:type III secretion system inner rod subunit SctI [Yersinia enterocolitica]|uniref:Type III secretion system inner rod subunit SctI n=1 Tax=Yersinia enterocolitica TaxID=630 RepID=A0AAD2V1A8_YEREN|nr:type III secretion system inner rod subunit SctI [Yersinia enterocolitica]EKN3394139.1 type III secretion system inner rod subunit SctI [Yersinia enterocolitica]EKN3404220.1 type III secretion system inner rod subunit SctI [Yersinia enterocolitica]EKN3530293.1 type III secretion system inner rod subunit SctI [Yersinia enterocolitica]EKN3572649.1 type III secretion system inner rod subunit SctI [Yersinia enterocolitica]EKN3579805.1 type III secretion system inner rod subunit SctI [Yersinia e
MEIDAINAAVKLNTPSQLPADDQHIAKFSQLMQQVEPVTPMISPDQFLSVQSEWMHATLAVDLTAKVAGVVGQNINKLVNMQ